INASNQEAPTSPAANSTVAVTTEGSIQSGTILTNSHDAPSGISAGFLGGTSAAVNLNVNGTVIVNNAANITASSGFGINAYNYGNGNITVNDGPGTTIGTTTTGVLEDGIVAQAGGGTTGLRATGDIAINVYGGSPSSQTIVTATSPTQGQGYGIFAF